MSSPSPMSSRPSSMPRFALRRNPFGVLVLSDAEGVEHVGVVPVRSFPVSAPAEGISLVSAEGRELAWIERLVDLPPSERTLVEEELHHRDFMPEVRRIVKVSGFACPCTWTVDTDRGSTDFILKGEEDIRRLHGQTLLIADVHGVQYLVRDRSALDRASRKILQRFM